MRPPPYFERIREEAAHIWQQLEASAHLAGPWHQMFKQVQSPRHVLSELLQNADDAGATAASIAIENGALLFHHDGTDFTEEQFESLCRFGFSNKRTLHTIGFRGIGFKSTFSLGNEVQLITPTLSVAFRRKRFSEPVWLDRGAPNSPLTVVRVVLKDAKTEADLRRNIEEWLKSPVSLLFFRNVRRLKFGTQDVRWLEVAEGPAPDSTWFALKGTEDKRYLLLRSRAEPFPPDAIAEIEEERILHEGDRLDLPPCQVEVVLGNDDRLFVVLPTGVRTRLPFATNAPFIQDPARLKVKDPESSPTNAWLLARVGALAAQGMLAWLGRIDLSEEERAEAYRLMPDIDRDDESLEGCCAAAIELSFDSELADQPIALDAEGNLVPKGLAFDLPSELNDIWPPHEAAAVFDDSGRTPLSPFISAASRVKLSNWRITLSLDRAGVIQRLRQCSPPQPRSWRNLLSLWSYLAEALQIYSRTQELKGARIVPVQGQSTLFAANDVVRIGEKRLLASDEDWDFLGDYLRSFNPNWGRYLADRRKAAEEGDSVDHQDVHRTYRLLDHLGLADTSDANLVLKRVSTSFFEGEKYIADCVRLAHIAARLGANVGDEFKFVTVDEELTAPSFGIVADPNGALSELLPAEWSEQHLLSDAYWSEFQSCSRDEWTEWLASGKAGVHTFAPLEQKSRAYYSKGQLNAALRKRGYGATYPLHFKTEHFALADIDFPEALWTHWLEVAAENVSIWVDLMDRILAQRSSAWNAHLDARVIQLATTGNSRTVISEGLPSGWVSRFRELPCLRDTRGVPCKPADLLRRTPETEPLRDLEPFVAADLDNETTRQLLVALGVRSTPTGPNQIMKRIRTLAEAPEPPIIELHKWYMRLDQLLPSCHSEEVSDVISAFAQNALIFVECQGWLKSADVFLGGNEEELPGAPVIPATLRPLQLWRRINVADRPSAELVIARLKEIESGKALAPEELKRVKALLPRLADSIWHECGCWLNLAGQWVPTADLRYSVSMRSLTKYQDLFPAVRQATADFQSLSYEQLDHHPFCTLPSLASQIEERLDHLVTGRFKPEEKPWLEKFATELTQIDTGIEDETERLRESALRLVDTIWRRGQGLRTVPYLDGNPAGQARDISAVWSGNVFYVEDLRLPALASPVAREIARAFNDAIGEAAKFCFERDAGFIHVYLHQEFRFSSVPITANRPDEPPPSSPVPSLPSENGKAKLEDAPGEDGATSALTNPASGDHEEESEDRTRQSHRPHRPSLIERYAESRGMSGDVSNRFVARSGEQLIRTVGNAFPWEERTGAGELIRFLLPIEHCLEREAIVIDTEIWEMIEKMPETHALLTVDLDSSPLVITGAELKQRKESETLTLFPAKYRLVSRQSVVIP